jgi:multidrug resistance efflux pump
MKGEPSMTLKQFAIRGLIALAIAIALCMFFARTIQNITTPHVSLVTAQNGRLDQRIYLEAKLVFPGPEPMTYALAREHSVLIEHVYARAGYPVKTGDLLFTAGISGYDDAMDKLTADYRAQAEELAKIDIENRGKSTSSEQNARYGAMLAAQEALSQGIAQVRALALIAGVDLPTMPKDWPAAAGEHEELLAAISHYSELSALYEAARENFYASFTERRVNINVELFKYINERASILEKMEGFEAQMAQIAAAKLTFSEVRAERDGYIVSVEIKEGDTYDGTKPAFTMNDPERPHVLRADVSAVSRTIEAGAKAAVKGDRYEWNTAVVATGIDESGRKYADLEINENELKYYGGASALIARGEGVTYTAYITYRAANAATLLPSGAVRDIDGDAYIYAAERSYDYFLSYADTGLKVRKMSVQVIDKSDKMVALADDLWGVEVAYREDRELSDGAKVMAYEN